MKCQNCGSNDIVTIQGQNYCINCGQLLGAAKKPMLQELKKELAKTVAPPIVDAVKPKAASFSTPQSTPRATDGIAHKVIRVATHANVLDLKNPQKPTVPAPAAKQADKKTAPPKLWWQNLRFAWKMAIITALPIGALIALSAYVHLNNDILLYGGLSASVLIAMVLLMAETAQTYGASRLLDNRPNSQSAWWLIARDSFGSVLKLNLIYVCVLVVLAVLAVLLVIASGYIPDSFWYVRAAVLALGNSLLAWVLISVFVCRRLAGIAVAVGGLSALAGLKTGWGMYRKHQLAMLLSGIYTILSQLAILGVCAVALTGMYLGIQGLHINWQPLVLAGGVTVIVTAVIINALEIETGPWLKRYRRYAVEYNPDQRVQLLNGHSRKFSLS